jgi:transposase InsO family protein
VRLKSELFRGALARLGIKHRYGATGRTDSIALIERFLRTLKTTARLRWRPPFLRRDLEHRLALTFLYYLWLCRRLHSRRRLAPRHQSPKPSASAAAGPLNDAATWRDARRQSRK